SDVPEYDRAPPRWGSESEVTLVFTGDPALHFPSPSEHSLDAIVERAEREGRLPPLAVVLDIFSQASSLLADAESPSPGSSEAPIHGRVSPRRIFLTGDGTARIDASAAESDAVSETSYQSPEQLRGLPIDARSDVFSLALSVCELLVLNRLVSDRNKVLAGPGVSDLATALRTGKRVPRDIGRVILRCLAKDAEQRYGDAGILNGALREAADKAGVTLSGAETGRFVRELFDESSSREEGEEETDFVDPEEDDRLEADADENDDQREEEDEDDDLDDDDDQMAEWGNLDVFASLSRSPSGPPPPSWAASLSPPARSAVTVPTPLIPPPPPLPATPSVRLPPMASAPPPRMREPLPAPPIESRPLPPPMTPPPSSRLKPPTTERAHTLPPPPPPLVSPPPMRGRGVAVDVEPKRLFESEPPSALTRSVMPGRWPVGMFGNGLRGPVTWKGVAVLGAIVAAAVVLVMLFSNKAGTVVVAAAGNLGQPLGNVTVVADGLKTCEGTARCVFQLAPGLHEMNVRADGYVGQERMIVVRSGEQSAVEFRLERSVSWLKLAARQDGTEVFVDDELAGVLPNQMPQSIEIASGQHRVRIAAKHFAPEEQKVDLAPGETRFLGGIALRAIIGKATFDVRTPGADLSLISETGQSQHVDPSQPLELDLSKRWVVEAHREGFSTYREPLNWNGDLER
ncbi:MAG TPA: hypothetical protein VGL13_14705, partial [Polyangiaceae bacterium]